MDERIELHDLRVVQSYLIKKVSKLEDKLRRIENEEEGEEEEDEPDEEDEDHSHHTETSESEEEDAIDELPTPIKAPPKFRKSVSAEAYGLYNKKGYF
jgi:ABC-type Zn2+ transport system substrate-binding protein/surface adhesin